MEKMKALVPDPRAKLLEQLRGAFDGIQDDQGHSVGLLELICNSASEAINILARDPIRVSFHNLPFFCLRAIDTDHRIDRQVLSYLE
jgi:hypothetical protein